MKKNLSLYLLFIAALASTPHVALTSQPTPATLATYGLQYGTLNHLGSVSSFDQAISSGAQIVVKFGASWCPPCQKLAPVISDLATEIKSVVFIEVNFDSFKDLANRYGIKSIPAILLFKNGSLIKKTVGYQDKASLASLINNTFGL